MTVFHADALGDQLLALPAMRALGALFPGGMQLLFGGVAGFVFRGLPFHELGRVSFKDPETGELNVDRIVADASPCEIFLSLSSWTSPSLTALAQALGARQIILSEPFDIRASTHTFDRLFEIPRRLDPSLSIADFVHRPTFSPAAEEAAARFAAAQRRPDERLLFLHPETKPEKMWSRAGFEWVLERFLDAHPEYRVVVVSHKPYPLTLGRHQDRCVTDFLHLELAYALLRHVDLFLGVDSCFLHAADLYRIPGVALFGPAEPSPWGPAVWGFRLSPRSAHICGGGAMSAISPVAVLDALTRIAREAQTKEGVSADLALRS